jgi:hypothetical protein
MVLEAVYEQDFLACSYGFRPGRSAHQALRHLSGVITVRRQHWVLDVDIRKYFDSIPHQELRAILDQRVTDGVIRRMIDKWLNAGVLEDGLLHFATEGTPQGGVISPILSNIFLHHVVDRWFEEEVRPRLSGEATLVRFADDFVMTFETHHDAKRVLEVLGKRLGRHGLTLHPDKTRFIDFRPQRRGGTHADCKDPPFDFLGFTHAWVKSRKGKNVVRQTTAKTKFCPRADRAQGLVPSQSASADPRSARPAVCQARRSLCHLRHHGELPAAGAVSPTGHEDVAQMVGTAHEHEAAHLGSLHRVPRPPSAATGQDHSPICHLKRSSPVKNRMREICTSGSVRGEGGNILAYSAITKARVDGCRPARRMNGAIKGLRPTFAELDLGHLE